MPNGFIDRECVVCGTHFKSNRLRCKDCLSERAMKTFKYRIYPNQAEIAKLEWTIERCRWLYNAALSGRRYTRVVPLDEQGNPISKMRYSLMRDREALVTPIAIVDEPISITKEEQSRELTELKRLLPEYQEIEDHVLRNVIDRVNLAFQAFFKRRKDGVGYPHIKGKRFYNSFSSDSGFKFVPRDNPKRADVALSKIGNIKIQLHRPLEGEIKRYIVSREGNAWYICFACEIGAAKKLPMSYEDVGIDMGIAHFAALSDGSFIENPRWYRQSQERLKILQQSLSRKKRGSARRRKAVALIAATHRKISNQRKDFHHKESRKIVDRFQIIAFEDLKISNMSKRPKPKQDEETGQYLPNGASAKAGLNKSILDAGWGSFIGIVEAKAKSAGRDVRKVPAMYTSQTCSSCGFVSKENRENQATFICKNCGFTCNADTNGAINVLDRAKD
jgi:putative transposase